MGSEPRSRAALFLQAHPALTDARASSSAWPRIREEAALTVAGRRLFLIAGDTLGGEEDLYLDRLARGAGEAGSDPLSRELFLGLSPELQTLVRRELLKTEG